MLNIAKPKFHVLDVSGQNYQSRNLDVELHLQGKGPAESLKENGEANEKDKANALILNSSSFAWKFKGLVFDNLRPFGFVDQVEGTVRSHENNGLPSTQYAWQHLRLLDFKLEVGYNSTFFDIVTRLELCGIKITKVEVFEKTFSIFHASNIILQQQYW